MDRVALAERHKLSHELVPELACFGQIDVRGGCKGLHGTHLQFSECGIRLASRPLSGVDAWTEAGKTHPSRVKILARERLCTGNEIVHVPAGAVQIAVGRAAQGD